MGKNLKSLNRLFYATTVLEEIELGLITGFEDTTALEDKKSLTVFFRYSGCLLNNVVVHFAH